MSLLNELGIKHRTDKGTHGKRGEEGRGHNYLRTYERHLPRDRHAVRRVLEIGVQRGASIRMWEEYFPNAQIYGLDIAESALSVTGERIMIRLVDQSDATALEAFATEFGPFDLIVEDGSHVWSHQITSLKTLLKHVAAGGRYIVEDLHTSFSPEFGTPGGVTGIEYVLRCCEKVLGSERVRTDDTFLNGLNDKVDTLMVMRNAAVFFCR
jgi:Methyltransferase domain